MAKKDLKKPVKATKPTKARRMTLSKILPSSARKLAAKAKNLIDERILKVAAKQYKSLAKELAKRRMAAKSESRLTLELGEKILQRAKDVRENLKNTVKRVKRSE
jgi:hypothetical protein